MEFFADRNLGRHIFPGVLRDAGLIVHVHDDHFPDNEQDERWLPAVAGRGWIILTSDRRILARPSQVDAAMESGAAVLVLIGASITTREHAQNFVNTFAKVRDFIAANEAPFIARIYRPSPVEGVAAGKPGGIEMALSHAEWIARRERRGRG